MVGRLFFFTLPSFDVPGSILLTAPASSQDRGDTGGVRGQNAGAGFMSRASLRQAVPRRALCACRPLGAVSEDVPVGRDSQ